MRKDTTKKNIFIDQFGFHFTLKYYLLPCFMADAALSKCESFSSLVIPCQVAGSRWYLSKYSSSWYSPRRMKACSSLALWAFNFFWMSSHSKMKRFVVQFACNFHTWFWDSALFVVSALATCSYSSKSGKKVFFNQLKFWQKKIHKKCHLKPANIAIMKEN